MFRFLMIFWLIGYSSHLSGRTQYELICVIFGCDGRQLSKCQWALKFCPFFIRISSPNLKFTIQVNHKLLSKFFYYWSTKQISNLTTFGILDFPTERKITLSVLLVLAFTITVIFPLIGLSVLSGKYWNTTECHSN